VIEDAIRSRLLDFDVITDLIGEGARARMYPVKLPQDPSPTWPAITYQIISGRPEYDIQGAAGVAEMRLQIDIWSAERPSVRAYDEVRKLGEYVRRALSGYAAAIDGTGYALQYCALENRRSLYDDGSQTHRESQDWLIAYAEA